MVEVPGLPAGFRVQLISKSENRSTGIGRYAFELHSGLKALNLDVQSGGLRTLHPPVVTSLLRRAGYDLEGFSASYPLRAVNNSASVTHITSQTLATLLFSQRLS